MMLRRKLHNALPAMLSSFACLINNAYCAPSLDPQYHIVSQFTDANGPAVQLANGKIYRLGAIPRRITIPIPIAIDQVPIRVINSINTAQPGALPSWFLRRQKIAPLKPKAKKSSSPNVIASPSGAAQVTSLLWMPDSAQDHKNFHKVQNALPASFEIAGLAKRARNQGSRDTCTWFAATLAVEAAYIHLNNVDVDLSEEYFNNLVKMHLIGTNIALPTAEIEVGLIGGGQIDTNFSVMRDLLAGIPEEADDPYNPLSNQLSPQPSGDILNFTVSHDQKSVDDVTVLDSPITLIDPPGTTLTPLPIAALLDATYRATAFDTAAAADLGSLDWYRQRISNGEPVVIQFFCCGNDGNPSGIWDPGALTTANAIGVHASLLIGYDDSKHSFLMRNSWGENTSRLFSYQFVTGGLVMKAISVTAVAPVAKGFGLPTNQAVLLGRWFLTDAAQPGRLTPTGTGSLDIYRLPSSNAGLGRLGTFFAEDGSQFRVNGQFVADPGNANGRLDFFIDTAIPDAPFTSSSGTHFAATYMFESTPAGTDVANSHMMMVGKVQDGSEQQFVLHKAEALPTSIVVPLTGQRPANQALIGWWEIYWEGEAGTLILKTFDPQTQNFTGLYQPFGASTWADAVGAVNGSAVVLLTGTPSTHLGIGGFADVNRGVISGHAPQLNVLNAFVAVLRNPTAAITLPAASSTLGPAAH
jgi:hypothetical protein